MAGEPSRLCRAALGYASKGWRVFPARPGEKIPQIAQWNLAATTNLDQIRRWWSQWPSANIGLATGQQSGLVVLDIDPRHGGFDTWHDLLDVHGTVDTLEAFTGGGGQHEYFQAPVEKLRNSAGAIGPGIDTRAEGGYVLAPPGIHPSGEPYEWITRVPPATLPSWLLERWPRHESGGTSPRTSSQQNSPDQPKAWQLLNNQIKEGQRNASLARLGGWVRLYHPEHVVEAMLQAWNLGLCQPPLQEEEVHNVVKSVFSYPQPGVNGHPRAVVPSFQRETPSDA